MTDAKIDHVCRLIGFRPEEDAKTRAYVAWCLTQGWDVDDIRHALVADAAVGDTVPAQPKS